MGFALARAAMTFGTCHLLQLRVMSTAMEPGSAKTFIAARKLSFKPELRAWSVFADLGSLNANTPVGSPPASTTAARGPLSKYRPSVVTQRSAAANSEVGNREQGR